MRPLRTAPVRYIVWHCSATRPAADIGAKDIDRMHRAEGWDGIGYHFVIRRDGRIELGEDLRRVGAHTTGNNYNSVGICMVGGISETKRAECNFTQEQWASAHALSITLGYMFPGATQLGHRDLSPDLDGDNIVEEHEWMKRCPCFNAKETFTTGQLSMDDDDIPRGAS